MLMICIFLVSSSHDIVMLYDAYNQIRNEYSSILKEYGLSLNAKKCCLKAAIEINDELKKSLYDEYFNGIQHDIEELFEGKFQEFLDSLLLALKTDYIDVERYNLILNSTLAVDDMNLHQQKFITIILRMRGSNSRQQSNIHNM